MFSSKKQSYKKLEKKLSSEILMEELQLKHSAVVFVMRMVLMHYIDFKNIRDGTSSWTKDHAPFQ